MNTSVHTLPQQHEASPSSGTSSSDSSSPSASTIPFPKDGIKVSFLELFIQDVCGGREALADLTTTQVVHPSQNYYYFHEVFARSKNVLVGGLLLHVSALKTL